MVQKLIKIEEEHYIIVDDSGIKSGDYRALIDKSSKLYGQFEKHLGGYDCNDQWMKITHSFGKHLEGVENRPLSEVKEVLFEYNVEKIAENKWNEITTNLKLDTLHKGMWCGGFQHGFKAHRELTKDRLFTINDMKRAIKMSKTLTDSKKREFDIENILGSSDDTYGIKEKYDEIDIIQTLLPKTEWDVEFVNDKLTLKQ